MVECGSTRGRGFLYFVIRTGRTFAGVGSFMISLTLRRNSYSENASVARSLGTVLAYASRLGAAHLHLQRLSAEHIVEAPRLIFYVIWTVMLPIK